MINGELIVDNFAGGGGASTGIEMATGYSVDIAINHDPEAIRMHKANHPNTMHYCEDVWQIDPVKACGCQGFPDDYIIDHDYTGKTYPRSEQVRRCGNAVCPPIPAALVKANLPELCIAKRQPICRLDRIQSEKSGQMRFA